MPGSNNDNSATYPNNSKPPNTDARETQVEPTHAFPPKPPIEDICVFCGSLPGTRPIYLESARQVGRTLAKRKIDIVYGGGRVGLMGALADAAIEAGGKVFGIIPDSLMRSEIAHEAITELAVVPDMHTRKAQMHARSDAFLTLPGGIGTFEEIFEIFSWATLGIHKKPIGILNVDGYYNPLIQLLDHAIAEGFIRPQHRDFVVVSDRPDDVIDRLIDFVPPPTGIKWFDLEKT
jgi:uncharacterized protein (TIGR00730 family)